MEPGLRLRDKTAIAHNLSPAQSHFHYRARNLQPLERGPSAFSLQTVRGYPPAASRVYFYVRIRLRGHAKNPNGCSIHHFHKPVQGEFTRVHGGKHKRKGGLQAGYTE